jgi:hypothetical protein
MVAAAPPPSAAAAPPQAPAAPAQPHPSFFHRLLSELNPLQYLPVVGTIYRAVTGDEIPEEARFAGSLVVSGLTSGPIGVAINLGTTALERVTGIDPEAVGTRLLAGIGIGGHAAPAHAYAKADTGASQPVSALNATPAPAPLRAAAAKSWSPAQLTAYGVVQGAGGTLTRGSMSGADVLNSLELTRLGRPDGGTLLAAVA